MSCSDDILLVRCPPRYNITAYGTNTSGANAFNLWSTKDQLFYRDDSYVGKKAANGAPVFWARGVGWAFGAMARALEALPESRVRQVHILTLL